MAERTDRVLAEFYVQRDHEWRARMLSNNIRSRINSETKRALAKRRFGCASFELAGYGCAILGLWE
jgi:hypothetical protein